ncbi:MAG: transcription antitermination protein NusB [Micavibrio sp.]|nr:transcription antitermination protein NusB [Micavibrio sp.]
MTNNAPKQEKPTIKAKALAARLRAVQAVYQKMQNQQQPMRVIIEEYLSFRAEMDVDGEPLVPPDGALFKKILLGVDEKRTEIDAIIDAHLKKDAPRLDVEPLLRAILICGCYELLIHETDAPIIINDYLNVGHGFFNRNEVGLLNGVLDNISKLFH